MKKFLLGLIGASPVLGAFADESTGSSGPDLSAATTALTGLTSAVTDWVADVAPALALLLGGVLVISLIWVVFKWVKRGTSKA